MNDLKDDNSDLPEEYSSETIDAVCNLIRKRLANDLMRAITKEDEGDGNPHVMSVNTSGKNTIGTEGEK
jgi:hypothetical protein